MERESVNREDFIVQTKRFEDLLHQLKTTPVSEISDEFVSKLNIVFEKLSYLLTSWDVNKKNCCVEYKIDESLWNNNHILRYVFEECITYAKSVDNTVVLYCVVCKEGVTCNHESLVQHLFKVSHKDNFNEFKIERNKNLWKNFEIYKHAFEKFICISSDNKLYCKICGINFPFTHIHLLGHLNRSEHNKRFEDILSLMYGPCNSVDDQKPAPVSIQSPLIYGKEGSFGGRFINLAPEKVQKSQIDVCYTGNSEEINLNEKFQETLKLDNFVVSKDFKSGESKESYVMCKNIEMQDELIPQETCLPNKLPQINKITNNENKVNKISSQEKLCFEKHTEFMNTVILNKLAVKYFCEVCLCYNICASSKEIIEHLILPSHTNMLKLKVEFTSKTFHWNHCDTCEASLFCDESIFTIHNKHEIHLQLLGSPVEALKKTDKLAVVTSDYLNSCVNSLSRYLQVRLGVLQNEHVSKMHEKTILFYCYPCNYFVTNMVKWYKHLKCAQHRQKLQLFSKCSLIKCQCSVKTFSNRSFLKAHKKTLECLTLMKVLEKLKDYDSSLNKIADKVIDGGKL